MLMLLLDDDVVSERALIEEHIRSHQIHGSQETAILGMLTLPKENLTPMMYFMGYGGIEYGRPFTSLNSFQNHNRLYSFIAGNISIKRNFLLQNGIFDESFKLYWGDIELGYRLIERGLSIYFNKMAIGEHHKYLLDIHSLVSRQYICGRTAVEFYKRYPDAFSEITDLKGLLNIRGDKAEEAIRKSYKRAEQIERRIGDSFRKDPRIIPSLWREYEGLCRHRFYQGLIERYREIHPEFDYILDLCKRGIFAGEKGELERASSFFHEGVSRFPDFYPLRWHLVSALFYSGKYKRCEEEIEKSIEIFPSSIWCYYTMGSLLKRTDRLKQSLKYFLEVIRRASYRLDMKEFRGGAYFHIGMIMYNLGRNGKAVESFNNCLKDIPSHRMAKKYLIHLEK
jgi:tetratricopeptide (TPR) repeat protein